MSSENLKEANGDHLSVSLCDQITDEASSKAVAVLRGEISNSMDVTPKKKRRHEKKPPDPTDPMVIAAKAAIVTAKMEAEAAIIAQAELDAIPTPMEEAKYYISLALGTACIVSAFTFLFLVPFVLDPAISTLMHDFADEPVVCKVSNVEVKQGKKACLWSSCREGCTVELFTCWQVRVIYAPGHQFSNVTQVEDLREDEWVDLMRFDILENKTMIDTPLLVNIKGCGYPPEVACPRFASDYEGLLNRSETFPCYYSRVNPWIVIEVYEYDSTLASTLASIIVPNVIFVVSLSVLLYWYCPYCQAKCQSYEEQIDQEEEEEAELEVDSYNSYNSVK